MFENEPNNYLEEEEDEDSYDAFLTDDVKHAIAEILPSNDPLDNPDFDLVQYINELFPNEQSLSNIDEFIRQDQETIKQIDDDIRAIIHHQSDSAQNGKYALEDAQKAILHLFAQIKDIKNKAEKSEEMVKEITRDIKQLDVAKKNLTFSITTLNHLFILVEGVEKLELLINVNKFQDYSEIAIIFQRVLNVIDHFESYNHLEQVDDLSKRVKVIKNEITTKIKNDFEETFANPFTKVLLSFFNKFL
jgi:vacuolar protein sorting-associated protein 53